MKQPPILLVLIASISFLISCHPKESAGPQPQITYPSRYGAIGDTVCIDGHYFDPNPSKNSVTLNGKPMAIVQSDTNRLCVVVPLGATDGVFRIDVGGQSTISRDTFLVVTGKWYKRTPLENGRFGAFSFSANGLGYVGTGTGAAPYYKDLWAYDPQTNRWQRKADFGGGTWRSATSFVIGQKAYICGGGSTDFNGPGSRWGNFWEYDLLNDKWNYLGYAGMTGDYPVGLSINGKGYLFTGGYTSYVYEYNPVNNQWIRKTNMPTLDPLRGRSGAAGFVIGNKAYVGAGNDGSHALADFYQYEPQTDKWTRLADIPSPRYWTVGFSVGNKGYIGTGTGNSRQFWEYDIIKNRWRQITDLKGSYRSQAISFTVADRAYVGMGVGYDVLSDLWEFEPR